jgi:hypothetical protein
MKKKRPGPKPKLISLYPLQFDEAAEVLLKAKPKKRPTRSGKKRAGRAGKRSNSGLVAALKTPAPQNWVCEVEHSVLFFPRAARVISPVRCSWNQPQAQNEALILIRQPLPGQISFL